VNFTGSLHGLQLQIKRNSFEQRVMRLTRATGRREMASLAWFGRQEPVFQANEQALEGVT
jgi:hypothetical protein